ncbi:hypothetical protein Ahy_A02g008642 [Arachis hypogaea]|uniref:Uncharacterized protein n=1 Tax=Arachis hypogaea TaxID=3818 RepID=A0A445EFK2_ARAHY|nr:hypothetical protein Ahy_A02g008642 [Arachis hypogaea]
MFCKEKRSRGGWRATGCRRCFTVAMERNVNGKGNREAATWDLRKTALFCLASRFCKLSESSAAGNQHWSCPESLLLLPWELVLEPLMELLRLERVASETNDAWCISTLNRLKEALPLNLKVSLRSCLLHEYHTTLQAKSKQISGDFCEVMNIASITNPTSFKDEAHLQAENEKSKESAIRAFQSIFGKEKARGVRCDGRVTTPTLLKKNEEIVNLRVYYYGGLKNDDDIK